MRIRIKKLGTLNYETNYRLLVPLWKVLKKIIPLKKIAFWGGTPIKLGFIQTTGQPIFLSVNIYGEIKIFMLFLSKQVIEKLSCLFSTNTSGPLFYCTVFYRYT